MNTTLPATLVLSRTLLLFVEETSHPDGNHKNDDTYYTELAELVTT